MMGEKQIHRDGKTGVGGWLLVLCLVLIGWGPAQLALVIAAALPALAVRGVPLALLIVARIAAAGFGLAAGLALLGRRPAAVSLTRWSIVVSAALDTFVYLTPYFPSNRPPGDEVYAIAVTLGLAAAWLVYLARSRRVRATYE